MTKKSKVVRVVTEEQQPKKGDEFLLEEGELSEQEIELQEKLAQFKEIAGEKNYKVRIERFNDEKNKWVWLTLMPFEGFDPWSILKRFGSGQFRGVLLDESGRYVKGGIMAFDFEAPPPEEKKEESNPLESPVVAIIIDTMNKSHQNMLELMKTVVPAQAQAKQGIELPQMVDLFKSILGLAPKGDGMDKIKETLGLVKLIKETSDEGGNEGGILSEIKDAISLLPELARLRTSGALPNPRQPAGAPRALPQPTVKETPMTKVPVPESEAARKALFYAPKFEQAAKDGDVQEKWSEFLLMIVDNEIVPALCKQYSIAGIAINEDTVYTKLIEAAENPEMIEKLFLYAPTLAPYREWVMQVIRLAVEELTSEDTPANAPPGGENVS